MYTVYQHVNKENGKQYIGITKQKPEDRWGVDGRNYSSSPCFGAAISKYGWDNFEHNILETNLTKDQACQREQYYIQKLNTMIPFGYNMTTGGEMTQMSNEAKTKLSNSMKGNTNGLGKQWSEEKKKKISDAQKGRSLSEEHKEHLRKRKSVTHPCSEQKRLNIIKNKKDKKPVKCIETNVVYESIQQCARQLGLQATLIVRVCKGTLHTTGGFHFEYC